jgi:hypothetical protein
MGPLTVERVFTMMDQTQPVCHLKQPAMTVYWKMVQLEQNCSTANNIQTRTYLRPVFQDVGMFAFSR